MIGKHKKVCRTLNFMEYSILVSSVTWCVSISPFAFLVCIPVGIMSSVMGSKIFVMTVGIKKYKKV